MSTIERYGDKNKNMDRNQCDKSWSTTKAPLSPLGPKMKQQNRRCSQKKKARAADKQTRYDAEEVPQIAIWLASWFILPRVDVVDSISFFPFLVAFIDQENRGGTDPGKKTTLKRTRSIWFCLFNSSFIDGRIGILVGSAESIEILCKFLAVVSF